MSKYLGAIIGCRKWWRVQRNMAFCP